MIRLRGHLVCGADDEVAAAATRSLLRDFRVEEVGD
jgi:hypothetical protein